MVTCDNVNHGFPILDLVWLCCPCWPCLSKFWACSTWLTMAAMVDYVLYTNHIEISWYMRIEHICQCLKMLEHVWLCLKMVNHKNYIWPWLAMVDHCNIVFMFDQVYYDWLWLTMLSYCLWLTILTMWWCHLENK